MLKRYEEARAVAPVLRTLSPSLRVDMQQFEAASTPADRHVAGLRLLLRTPGLRATVKGLEDDVEAAQTDLPRTFDHMFRRNWWCSVEHGEIDKPAPSPAIVELLLYSGGTIPPPAFLSSDEVTAARQELAAMDALGPAPNYLAAEAVKWAKARPADLDAAEALAHAVEGTRWGCTDNNTTASSRAAFQTLHQLFPKTEWARKTKYWY
jgi:hypothetical protein